MFQVVVFWAEKMSFCHSSFWIKQTFHLAQIGSSELVYLKKNILPLVTYESIFEKISIICLLAILVEFKNTSNHVLNNR